MDACARGSHGAAVAESDHGNTGFALDSGDVSASVDICEREDHGEVIGVSDFGEHRDGDHVLVSPNNLMLIGAFNDPFNVP